MLASEDNKINSRADTICLFLGGLGIDKREKLNLVDWFHK